MNILQEPDNAFGYSYNRWRETRVKKLVSLFSPEWFKGKRILELACAYGNIGLYLKQLGANVTFADARQEHLDVVRTKDSTANTMLIDQDLNWNIGQRFDMVIHFGVLYHLDNWQQDLASVIQHTNLVVLESAVADTSDDFEVKIAEEPEGGQNAYNTIGTMPSAKRIENCLTRLGCSFRRYDDTDLNTRRYFYDWQVKEQNLTGLSVKSFEDLPVYGGRRFWVIKKLSSTDQ